jgi:hypothetical protein
MTFLPHKLLFARPCIARFSEATVSYNNWETGRNEPPISAIKKLFEMGATVEELFDIPYSSKPPKADLKVTKEEATEIVRVGLFNLIGSVEVMQNGSVLKG